MMDLERIECYSRFETIPDAILENILLLRPYDIRIVIQCLSVCKRWYSVISAFRRSNKNKTSKRFTLLFQWHVDASVNPEFPVLIAPDGNKNSFFDFMGPLKSTDVVASCHDLLLVQNCVNGATYYVVNPFLRQWIPLPHPPRLSYPDIRVGMSFKAGFLWDYCDDSTRSNNLAFMVIRICCGYSKMWQCGINIAPSLGVDNNEFRVQIFSSDTNNWTEYMVDWYPFKLTHCLFDFPIVSHNKMFHWLNGNSLVSLDPFDLKLNGSGVLKLTRVIKLPKRLNSDNYTLMGLGVSGGHLRVIGSHNRVDHNSDLRRTTVWQLDEAKISDPNASELRMWCAVHKFDLDKNSQFLAFHPYEGDVIFFRGRKYDDVLKINMICDRTQEKFERHKPSCWLRDKDNCPPLPPLVLPWYPTVLNPVVT